jgi:prepilin-type N-terminal cleavage/methylation domain-containing protein/prepilin-type processing-associated H-X9-DG protein
MVRRRPGVTLIEVIVAMAIIGILIGLLLTAVIQIRAMAERTKCANNHRQVILAVHHYAEHHNGQLPMFEHSPAGFLRSPHSLLLPYLEQRLGTGGVTVSLGGPYNNHVVLPYVCPADPNYWRLFDPSKPGGAISSALNWQVFGSRQNLNSSVTDGLSNTLATAEHYAWCNGITFWIAEGYLTVYASSFAGPTLVRPVTTGSPPTSIGDDPGNPQITFQVRPPLDQCNPNVAQTGHSGGMVVSFLDGSVRTLRGDIERAVYWGVTTPDRGEIINLD